MGTLLNDKTKRMFFALYWDQELGLGLNKQVDTLTGKLWKAQSAFTESLQLKSLTNISDEDAIVGYKLLYPNEVYAPEYMSGEFKSWLKDEFGIGKIKHKWDVMHVLDYLRSKGYALPFMGLSVEVMVNEGWILLI